MEENPIERMERDIRAMPNSPKKEIFLLGEITLLVIQLLVLFLIGANLKKKSKNLV